MYSLTVLKTKSLKWVSLGWNQGTGKAVFPLEGLATAAAKSRQSCPTLCDPIDGSPPGSHPWDSPGKNTGVGCHFLLQCMKVKSESEVAQSYPTLHDPMDCSLPGSSVHGISQARVLWWVAIAEGLEEDPFPLLLKLLVVACIPRLVIPSSTFKVLSLQSLLS